jgi:hypothetical protein
MSAHASPFEATYRGSWEFVDGVQRRDAIWQMLTIVALVAIAYARNGINREESM